MVVGQARAALVLIGFSVLGMMRRKTQVESAVFAARWPVEKPVEILRMKVSYLLFIDRFRLGNGSEASSSW